MRIVVFDTEHSDGVFHPWEKGFYLTCVGVVTLEGGERHEDLIWFDHRDKERSVDGVERLQSHVEGADLLVAHHAKHDVNVVRAFGVDFADTPLHCTQVVDYLINGQDKTIRYSLDEVAARYNLGQKHDKIKDYWDDGTATFDIPAFELGPYCLQDCHLTLDIYLRQLPRIKERNLARLVKLQNEFVYVLSDMETNGIRFVSDVAQDIIQEFSERADEVNEKIMELVDFEHKDKINLSSPQQLSAFLYGGLLKLSWREWTVKEFKHHSTYEERPFRLEIDFPGVGFKPNEKDKKQDGYYTVDKDTIRGLVSPKKELRAFKRLLVEYSELKKVVTTLHGAKGDKGLLAKVQADGHLHPSFNQTVTATGRLSSSDPNGQNLPSGNTSPIKTCFVPTLDGIMQVDLSQVEWRAAAWLSQDPVMMKEIRNGVDQHAATVVELMEMEFIDKKDPKSKQNRTHAKVFNFRMIYGGSEWGYYLDIDMPNFSLKKWRRIIANFFRKYAGLKAYHNKCIRLVFRNGELTLPTGRWFKFNKKHIKGEYTYAENQIKNFPVQGLSGGDLLPLMAVVIRRGMQAMGLESKAILTVHDSLVFDYKKEERDALARLCYRVGNNLQHYIKAFFGIDWNVPLEVEVEIGPNYGILKELTPKEVGL